MKTVVLKLLLAGLGLPLVAAQTLYPTTPDWTSADRLIATGGALHDLNRDGWLDFVVSNGNDILRQRVTAYYNRGDGAFPASPDWQSADSAYHGHLDIADVNGDGWPDVAVALLLNEGGPCAKLYLNNNGTLATTPSWTSGFIAPAFTVAFGDANGDGRPDLAVGTGDAYQGNPHVHRNIVHLNVGGTLETTPTWQSADTWCYDSVLWLDANNDGWLDLAGLGSRTYTWVYPNLAGSLSTTTAWRTSDVASQFGLMAAAGDIDRDGRLDLVLADNNQLMGGSGRFRRYNGQAAGYFSTTADWTFSDGYCSAVCLADVDADGDLDLATGAWWDRTRIFLNDGGAFGPAADWNSAGTSVVEKVVFGDIDRDGLVSATQSFGPASRRLFYLDHQPVQSIEHVRLDGVELTPAHYTASLERGWISVFAAPVAGLDVDYTFSTRLDMVITNWDDTLGNYLYYNRLPCAGDANSDGVVNLADLAALLSHFGLSAGAGWADGDFDADGDVDLSDLARLLASFGAACA